MRLAGYIISVLALSRILAACSPEAGYDVVIIGGGTSGTAAAVQAARGGAKVLLVEEHQWLGGMLTSAGVSATDGCYSLRGGIWAEFRDSLEAYYGGADALKTGWVSNVMFEPSVGNRIFQNIAAREKSLDIMFCTVASSFEKTGYGWDVSLVQDGIGERKVRAGVLVDATELGDVARAAGVPCSVGMDSRYDTGEDVAPEKANGIIQDLTYVMILRDYGHPVPIPEPEDYFPSEFACCCVNRHCVSPKEKDRMWNPADMMAYGRLPGGKYMINWPIEGNDYYCNIIDEPESVRDSVLEAAKARSLRFLYFIQNELGLKNIGMSEEFPTADGFPFIPYYRESRRIDGVIRFDLNDIEDPYGQDDKLYRTAVAVGDYPVDQHHTRYHGWEELPNLYFHSVPSYGVPMGVMFPSGFEDLLVIEKSISVTNVVNGTTRLQPVTLQLGQAAGAVAALAAVKGCRVSEVPVREVQKVLLDAGAYLLPLLDRPVGDKEFKPLQRIAATGIIRYEGMSTGWANQSWIYPDRMISQKDLYDGVVDFYSEADARKAESLSGVAAVLEEPVDVAFISSLSGRLSGHEDCGDSVSDVLEDFYGKEFGADDLLTRGQCAVVIDSVLDPFGSYDVDFHGFSL